MACDNQINLVHYLVKPETVFPSQKDDSHFNLADFWNDQFSLHFNVEGGNIIFERLASFPSEAVQPFGSQYKNLIKKNAENLIQQSAILNDTNNTDNGDSFGEAMPKRLIILP